MSAQYDVIIEKGRSDLNDKIIAVLKENIPNSKYLDVGCNTGWLLSEVPNGFGIDNSTAVLKLAKRKGLNVMYGDISKRLPFSDNSYPTVVLSCVLQQVDDPLEALWEAMRISSQRVIGVAPYPGKSEWGRINGNKWTKSVLWPEKLIEFFNATIIEIDPTHYFFEIKVRSDRKIHPFARKRARTIDFKASKVPSRG